MNPQIRYARDVEAGTKINVPDTKIEKSKTLEFKTVAINNPQELDDIVHRVTNEAISDPCTPFDKNYISDVTKRPIGMSYFWNDK